VTVVDASVFVSGMLIGEERHSASRQWLEQQTQRGEEIVIPAHALAEIAGALSRRESPRAARLALDQLLGLPGLTVVEIDHDVASLSAELAASLRLRGADAVYVAVAVLTRKKLITWDHEVRSRAAAAVDVGFPET
jgi:predicted nucleic acid-binding protein